MPEFASIAPAVWREAAALGGGIPAHLFLLGPSGAGKSTVAAALAARRGYLHLELDRYPDGDGIDLAGIRSQWDSFRHGRDPSALVAELSRRAAASGAGACALSFPSGYVLPPGHVAAAQAHGVDVRILYGSAAACIGAFLDREAASGRGLDADWWMRNNDRSYLLLSRPEFAARRLEVFASDGAHLPLERVVEALCGPAARVPVTPMARALALAATVLALP